LAARKLQGQLDRLRRGWLFVVLWLVFGTTTVKMSNASPDGEALLVNALKSEHFLTRRVSTCPQE
jgi:hypothetical protein